MDQVVQLGEMVDSVLYPDGTGLAINISHQSGVPVYLYAAVYTMYTEGLYRLEKVLNFKGPLENTLIMNVNLEKTRKSPKQLEKP